MEKEKRVEDNFADMLAMLKKKVQEKDEEIKKLRKENEKLKEIIPEEELNSVLLDETFKRR
jgi:predicted  nucleic acid-binding Zn-ribbon protein